MQWVPGLTVQRRRPFRLLERHRGRCRRRAAITVSGSTRLTSPRKLYPFYKKTKWKTEPFILAGYGWTHLIPNSSGDSFRGGGWLLGLGAIHPITTHLFLDGRFSYQDFSYSTVNFLGQEGSISPEIAQHVYSLSMGVSYRI